MMADNDDQPPWQRTPWWYGLASRDWVLLGFVSVTVLVAIVIFVLVVLMHEPI
jgi:hypothetical protein